MPAPLLFHWFPNAVGEVANQTAFMELCWRAESAGIDSVNVTGTMPEALALATTAGTRTSALRFRVSCDPADLSCSLNAARLAEASTSLGNRLILHIRPREIAASRSPEYAARNPAAAPDIQVEGDGAEAAVFAIKHGNVLWRSPDWPHQVYADALPVLHFGKAVGLATILIVRETSDAAVEAATALFPMAAAERVNDTSPGSAPGLWRVEPPGLSGKLTAMVSSWKEAAGWIFAIKEKGISQFLFHGWPETKEMIDSSQAVIPMVRALERGSLTVG